MPLFPSFDLIIDFDHNPFHFLVRFSFSFHASSLKVRHFLSNFKQTILLDGNGKRLLTQGHTGIEDVFLRKMYVSSLHDFQPQMKDFFLEIVLVFFAWCDYEKKVEELSSNGFLNISCKHEKQTRENVTVIFFLARFEPFFSLNGILDYTQNVILYLNMTPCEFKFWIWINSVLLLSFFILFVTLNYASFWHIDSLFCFELLKIFLAHYWSDPRCYYNNYQLT